MTPSGMSLCFLLCSAEAGHVQDVMVGTGPVRLSNLTGIGCPLPPKETDRRTIPSVSTNNCSLSMPNRFCDQYMSSCQRQQPGTMSRCMGTQDSWQRRTGVRSEGSTNGSTWEIAMLISGAAL